MATKVTDRCGADVELTLIDQAEGFVFGFSKLDVMFGRTQPEQVLHRYAGMSNPGVRFVPAAITAIDPVKRRVETTAGSFDADILVVALGADLHPEATPGLLAAATSSTPSAKRSACARSSTASLVAGSSSG